MNTLLIIITIISSLTFLMIFGVIMFFVGRITTPTTSNNDDEYINITPEALQQLNGTRQEVSDDYTNKVEDSSRKIGFQL